MAYYKRLRDMREDFDLTQRDIAAKLGIAQSQFFLYEKGYRNIPTDLLVKLAEIYDTSTDYLLGRTNNPHRIPDKDQSITGQRPFYVIVSYVQ